MINLISIQINGQPLIEDNLAIVEQQLALACDPKASFNIVVLPECFSIFGVGGAKMLAAAEQYTKGPIQQWLGEQAAKFNCYLVGGTTPILDSTVANSTVKNKAAKYSAASLVYNPQGKCISRYNKIHMFDVEVADATKSYYESQYTQAGTHLSLFNTPFAQVAQSVCYDLRFSDMFSAYANFTQSKQAPEIIVVPSAFTYATGKAHWHALLQARSIENQCFVVASNQVGVHADKRKTFGNSCIYSPWGECLSLIENTEGYASAIFDPSHIKEIRAKMPIWSHKKERYTLEP